MIKGFIDIFYISEIRKRIFITIGIIIICRMAGNIPCPGINSHALAELFQINSNSFASDGLFGMFDMFTGGAMKNFAISTLGIIPYISASIIMQMLQPIISNLSVMLREGGEEGRSKFNQYIKYLTFIICIFQGIMASYTMIYPDRLGLISPRESLIIGSKILFTVTTTITLICGTMIFIWLGEKITEYGIGNGASVIITIGILSKVPQAFYNLYEILTDEMSRIQNIKLIYSFILIMLFIIVIIATILLIQGHRRVPIQYVRGNNSMISSKTNYIPLRINFSGVMPIILSSVVMMAFSMILRIIPKIGYLSSYLENGGLTYTIIFAILILLFSYFWVANQFDPVQLATSLRRDGAFIPGIRPGKFTSEYFDTIMTKITLSGSIFLILLSIFPMFIHNQMNIPFTIASFFGGTSLLIIVGVLLDMLRQLESQMIMRNYDTFFKEGAIIGRKN